MNLKEKLISYENKITSEIIYEKKGCIPVILTAPHTMKQIKEDGSIKLREPYTKAIAMYVSDTLNTFSLIKIMDTGIDANSLNEEEFKKRLIDIIKENDIKLLIDIHGASIEREFDVELGTLHNLSADFSTINELVDAFHENGIKNVSINDPFYGGGITQSVYSNTDIDCIQIEINRRYRDIDKIENVEKICNALIAFINQYISR